MLDLLKNNICYVWEESTQLWLSLTCHTSLTYTFLTQELYTMRYILSYTQLHYVLHTGVLRECNWRQSEL